MKPEYKKKSIRSFVIRAGRMTDGQKRAFDQWWPHYGLSLFDGELNFKEVFGRHAPVVLEVGFGILDNLFPQFDYFVIWHIQRLVNGTDMRSLIMIGQTVFSWRELWNGIEGI